VVQLQHPTEGRLRNLADGDIVLPLEECLLNLINLGPPKEVLRADQGRCQKLKLGLLFNSVLVQLHLQSLFFI
jgi:hypothetical protein